MTVNPGWGGQDFIRSCLKKIETLRHAAPEVDIEVDGGIAPATLRECRSAGANVFVAGSYLVSCSSLSEGLGHLREACG
jgi:ribulose-phosphate 3-epimerase